MIEIEELRIKQAEFEGTRQELKKNVNALEKKRNAFLKRFPTDKLDSLSIEQYVIGGKYSKDSFCYWLENLLSKLGNIHGATSFKFGIYYGTEL